MDYRALLVKYMQCCIECDGATHLMFEYPESLRLSQEDVAALESAASEAKEKHVAVDLAEKVSRALIIAELERRDRDAGTLYAPESPRECCFEGCPKCTPAKAEGPSILELRRMLGK